MIQLLCIHDKKAHIYKNPWPVASIPEAIRSLTLLLRQDDPKAQNMMSQFPEDFQVCKLGEFDEQTGKMTCYDYPEILFEVYTLVSEEKFNA